MIRYSRAPSPALRDLLLPGGFLAPLLTRRTVDDVALDVHLRQDDHVNVYCGLTCLLEVTVTRGRVRCSASATYEKQRCASGLFRTWNARENGLEAALQRYFDNVVVGRSWLAGEGQVQAAWSKLTTPWAPFDREAVLGYGDARRRVAPRTFPAVEDARAEVEEHGREHRWAAAPTAAAAAEVDQLAVDREGRLVLIELKDAAASSEAVYYAPLQLLRYVHEWAVAYETVRPSLDAICEARVAVGLSPKSLPKLASGLRPVIGFGPDRRSQKVRARTDIVLSIVNRYLPPGVPPIEVWALDTGTLHRIS